jgi:hypothetical protein
MWTKAFALPWDEKSLAVEALLRLVVVRVTLLISQPDLRPTVRPDAPSKVASPADIALAIDRAAKLLPGSSCLPKAIAGIAMLARHGYASRLRIGLKNDAGHLAAHAWVEYEGNVLLGGAVSHREFHALPELKFQEHSRAN